MGERGDRHKSKRHNDRKSRSSERSSRRRREEESSGSDGSSTSEETRRQRRIRKQAKRLTAHLERHPVAQPGQDDDSNAFGDPALSRRFVWGKKLEQSLARGAAVSDLSARAEARRHRERLEEAERVRQRRDAREREREAAAAEAEAVQRERAAAEAGQLESREREFYLEQERSRVETRLRERRAGPADHVFGLLHGVAGVDVAETRLEALLGESGKSSEASFRALLRELEAKRRVDCLDPQRVVFWDGLCAQLEAQLIEGEATEPSGVEGAATGWHGSVDAEISAQLEGRSAAELERLAEQARDALRARDADSEYWSELLARVDKARARVDLGERWDALAARYLAGRDGEVDVGQRMGWDREEEEEEERGAGGMARGAEERASLSFSPSRTAVAAPAPFAVSPAAPPPRPRAASPQPLDPALVRGQKVVSAEDDRRALAALRAETRQLESSRRRARSLALVSEPRGAASANGAEAEALYRRVVADPGGAAGLLGAGPSLLQHVASSGEGSAEEARFRRSSEAMMGDLGTSGDAPFGGSVEVDKGKAYWWHEQYRPRRPKYFNRVHTGYEWNKYNQTHYDGDNPPPKQVQGYKFNIFYPELIDPTKAPRYSVERDPASPDGSTCLLRFSAGPPYEDVAFRIVNKEWEYNYKKGFKSVFDRGMLHVYFNFKRQRYRR